MKAKGAVLLDLDWDNDLDLYFGFNNSYLFENIEGFFINITDSSDIDTDGLIGVVAGDVDNNGYPDIIKQRYLESLPHHLIMNDGNNVYNTVEYLPSAFLTDIHGQGLLDADLDGDLDIFIIQDEGTEQAFLFLNQGLNPFGEIEFIQSFVFEVDDLSRLFYQLKSEYLLFDDNNENYLDQNIDIFIKENFYGFDRIL